VCILPRRQEPEDVFMTPTWFKGGSDSSHTRQGGPYISVLLVTVVLKLFGRKDREIKRDRLPVLLPGISIHEKLNLFSLPLFSIPELLFRP
jgi:hypothetical protein